MAANDPETLGIPAAAIYIVDPSTKAPAILNSAVNAYGPIQFVDVTLTLDTSAYASGDLLADTTLVTGAVRAIDAPGVLQSVHLVDEDDQGAAMSIFFLDANVSMGTFNVAPSITDANARHILGAPISILTGDWFDLGGVRVAGHDAIGKVIKPAAGTSNIYVAVVNGAGTPTFTASGLKLRLGFVG